MLPPVDPVIVQLGPFTLRWYGLLMMLGVVAAVIVSRWYVARKGQNPDTILDMLLWVLIPGFIGARLYYVFIQSPRGPGGLERYLANPLDILAVWQGGIHIFGGFLLGGLALYLFLRINKLPMLIYLDAVALALPLGQAIARQANFINQELYGPPTNLPWGLIIEPAHRLPPYNNLEVYPLDTLFHPLFLYESLWNFIGFGLLFWVVRRFGERLYNGDVLLLYLMWYPFGRFFIEFLRTDSWFFPGTPFNMVHILSFGAFTASAIILIVRHRRNGPTAEPARGRSISGGKQHAKPGSEKHKEKSRKQRARG